MRLKGLTGDLEPFITRASVGTVFNAKVEEKMANHKSAEKRIRQTASRTEVNGARRSRIRTFIKKVEAAIATGDKGAAVSAFKAAEPEMMRGAQLGVVSKNTMSRKLSRLSTAITRIGA